VSCPVTYSLSMPESENRFLSVVV